MLKTNLHSVGYNAVAEYGSISGPRVARGGAMVQGSDKNRQGPGKNNVIDHDRVVFPLTIF